MKLKVVREYDVTINIGIRELCKFLGMKYKTADGKEMSLEDCEAKMDEKGIYYTIHTDYNDHWGTDVNTVLILSIY